jgi:RNA polymerase sigma-70 factor (ECF subfamily)
VSYSVTAGFPSLPTECDASAKPCITERAQPPLEEELCDEDLMAMVSRGARNGLAVLFRRYARPVRTLGHRILRDGGEADDLVQEVFLYIHRKSGLFDRSKGSARSWIIQVAYTQALIRRRQLKSHGFYSSGIMDNAPEKRLSSSERTDSPDIVEELFGKNGWKNLWDSLTECQRETFRLHFYEGCTFGEIAEKLGQSYVNIRHHYYRGLERFRKHAEENGLSWP